MKPYTAYKDSGIEWIGDIPEHWEIKKLKHLAHINPTKSSCDYSQNSDELVTFLPMEKVSEEGEVNSELKKPINELWNGFTYFRENDIIVAKITPCFENGKGAILRNIGSKIGFGSTEFHVIHPRVNKINSMFIYYNTRAHTFRKLGEAAMTGAAGQKRVPSSFIESYFLAVPTELDEQQSITNFLENKTSQIDTVIEKKQKQIELLKEERTAIINQAVTKGLNPDAPMKDSGIEWLGEVPEHWIIKKLKFLSSIDTGEKDTVDREEDGIYPFFVRSQTVEYINSYSFDGEAVLTAGDGVGVGKVFHYYNGKFDYHQRVYKISNFKEIYGKYLFYYMQENFHKDVMKISAKSTVDSLRLPMFLDFLVAYADFEEQKQIVESIEDKILFIDTLRNRIQNQITHLQEYRTALISNAVTGKIDVRNYHGNFT